MGTVIKGKVTKGKGQTSISFSSWLNSNTGIGIHYLAYSTFKTKSLYISIYFKTQIHITLSKSNYIYCWLGVWPKVLKGFTCGINSQTINNRLLTFGFKGSWPTHC